jgi:hypothetical protein
VRMRVATRRDRLNRELAENADPGSSPELALRASQLTSDRRRKQLVRSLRRVVSEAHSPRLTRPPVVMINRAAVRDSEDAIEAMVTRLNSIEPVRAQGMAIAERMLTNGGGSPLYLYGQPGALRRLVLGATAAMDSSAVATHEWPLAA